MTNPLRVMGIDASLRSTGIGLVEQAGTRLKLIECATVRNAARLSHSACLREIQASVLTLIRRHAPGAAAIEGGFFMKNAKTAMILGETRGVVIASCAAEDIPIYEYLPRRVKQALVGTGTAHKEQVARMVVSFLGLSEIPQEDAADALAIAICHLHSRSGHRVLDSQPI